MSKAVQTLRAELDRMRYEYVGTSNLNEVVRLCAAVVAENACNTCEHGSCATARIHSRQILSALEPAKGEGDD